MNASIVSIPFFPSDLPPPIGAKKRHEGKIETRMQSGHVKTRPDPMNTFDYFEYVWQGLSSDEYTRLLAFCQDNMNRPIAGWVHPGLDGVWVVAYRGHDMPRQSIRISGGSSQEEYDCIVYMRILKAGPI